MEIKIVNKIAVLIAWTRELDQLSKFIESLDDVIYIIDDLKYTEKERKGSAENLYQLLKYKKDCVFLSKIIGLKKYRILISTAQTFQEKITLRSYIRHTYAISIGQFIDKIGLSRYFLKTIGRPLNGGGASSKRFEIRQIERLIGEKTIFYPKGLDVNINAYPPNRLKNIFDLFLCHGNIDMNLIKKKFNDANCIKIGYPKYDEPPSSNKSKHIVSNEINGIDKTKKLLLWMPTHIKSFGESLYNIKIWSPVISKLSDKYNIVVRPHPKSLAINPKISNKLKNLGLIVDMRSDRELKVLYQAADLVLADYGSSVLSSIYMNKKILLLNMPNNTEFIRLRKSGNNVDQKIRDDVESFEYNDASLYKKIDKIVNFSQSSEIKKLKNNYFGNDNSFKNIVDIAHSLNSELLGE
jgi:hypothetical protein